MRRSFLPLLLLVSVTVSTFAQEEEAKTILDKTIEIMQTNYINTKNVDWTVVTAEANRLAENAKTPADLGNSIRYLLQSLDDFHARFRYKDSTFRWEKEKVIVPDFYKTAFATKGNKFFTAQFGDIGYLRIPAIDQEVAKEKAQALQDSLCKLLAANPKGLIFDLRLNGGGHVFSMIMGISNILKYGFVSPAGEIKNDGFYLDAKKILPFTETCERNHLTIPVIVITGPFTGSSAEGLAIVLKARPNTILIGEPTAGWVSSLNGFTINRNTGINLAVGYMTDVNHKVYKTKIQPDIFVDGGDHLDNLQEDAKIIKALSWFKEHP